MPTTTFANGYEDEPEELDDPEEQELDTEREPRRRRSAAREVPDAPVENAADIPLLVHAGTGKANTITYLKITRLDGARGVRGLKGQLPPESTYEMVARRFGNGTYKIEGCNFRHKVLAREEALEISIPGFDESDESHSKQPLPQQGGNPAFTLHGMRMIQEMSNQHADTVANHAVSSSQQVQAMASRTMEMLTAFTAAQRESERAAFEQSQSNQQTFFATLMKMQETGHMQQMQLLTAMQERGRGKELDPMALIKVFMDGLKAGGELGGGDSPEPWLVALKEGSGMLGHLAQLATTSGSIPGSIPGQGRPPTPMALPNPQLAPTAARSPAPSPTSATPPAKPRLPFKRDEIRGIAALRAQLRRRGIPLDAFLTQTTEYYRTAPDAELFDDTDSGDENSQFEGHSESADAANPHTVTSRT